MLGFKIDCILVGGVKSELEKIYHPSDVNNCYFKHSNDKGLVHSPLSAVEVKVVNKTEARQSKTKLEFLIELVNINNTLLVVYYSVTLILLKITQIHTNQRGRACVAPPPEAGGGGVLGHYRI